MDVRSDSQLLCAYAEKRSDEAFAALVHRHIDLVHSAALRMVNDSHLAQDVTQNTFVALAKNAADLKTRPVITGWLHRTAQNIAAQTVRTDVRRRNREQEATTMNHLLSETPDASWQEIAPQLDAALGQLDDVDHDAVLLRYFEKKSAREMAAQLGISDDAAQKRVSRAVERLRVFFAKRGVTVGASGLAVVISANAVQAAPVGLALTISTAAALTGTTLAATKAIAMTTLQKTIVTATIAVLAGAGIYELRKTSQLREQIQTLQQQQAPLVEQVQHLGFELDKATNRLASLADENERLKSRSRETEILKLRGEVAVLRQQNSDLKIPPHTLQTAQTSDAEAYSTNILPRAAWEFAGYETPAATVCSMMWAKSTGDFQTFLNSIVPETTNDVINGYSAKQSPDLASSKLLQETKNLRSLQILKEIALDQDTVIVQTMFSVESGGDQPVQNTLHMVLKKTNGQWKYQNEFVPRH